MKKDSEQNNWKEDIRNILVKTSANGFEIIAINEIVSSLLSSQAHALKEWMKEKIPEHFYEKEWNDYDEGYYRGFNDCREQTLNNLDNI